MMAAPLVDGYMTLYDTTAMAITGTAVINTLTLDSSQLQLEVQSFLKEKLFLKKSLKPITTISRILINQSGSCQII